MSNAGSQSKNGGEKNDVERCLEYSVNMGDFNDRPLNNMGVNKGDFNDRPLNTFE